MCGIWTIIGRKGNLTPEQLASYEKIRPRGPEHSILFVEPNSLMGFHRLAINDLTSRGEQPFYYSDENYKYTCMCNAEFYNAPELVKKHGLQLDSTSDTAVILPLFRKFKDNFHALNLEVHGEYAMFITRQEKKTGIITYWLSVDPLSVRPAFYFSHDDQFGASSLLCGLSEFSRSVIRLDQGTMLTGRYDPQTHKNTLIDVIKYTVQPKIEYFEQNMELYKLIVDTFVKTVEYRMLSDRPLGSLLSGGLDSSLVAAVVAGLLKKQGKKLKTFSIGMNGSPDIEFAKEVADHIGSDHYQYSYSAEEAMECQDEVLKVTETFDITTNRSSVPLYLLCKKISKETDVVVLFNGDGADECQMGYLYFYMAPDPQEAKKDRDRLLQQIHLYDGIRVDRNVSHWGMEARLPYLDSLFVDLFYKIDPKLLVPTKDRPEKYLLRKAFETLWPDLIPSSVLWRKKEAFSDGVSSTDNSWHKIARKNISEKLHPQFCRQIMKNQKSLVEFQKEEGRYVFPGLKPVCEESYYYRMKISHLYNNNDSFCKHYWLPSWTDQKDPSARELQVYDQTDVKILKKNK